MKFTRLLLSFIYPPTHPPADAVVSPGLRRLAWFNIAIQVALPLAVAFTPLIAGAEPHLPHLPASPFSASGEEGDEQAQKVAGYASQAGNFLASGINSDAAASTARGMASGAAENEIRQWLERAGTARVQLNTDKNFSLKNAQLDLLVPLYEQKDRLVFTQGSIHRTDDRSQANLGLGYRRFADDWMLGGNAFLDYDLSRDHARLGLGGEYWRDFLKLGVNSYHRLTNWQDSPELADYQARPANGWDIRMQGWLPALPQLGGTLTYEQYYGNEVALSGKNSRQRNPYAVTGGVNYTPFPLLTFSAERRQGKSGENDSRFGVAINYQPGVPWQQQINPGAVAGLRTLPGSRYDLVERNNNIVLEYRKQDVIHLQTAERVTGFAGEQKSLGVSVTSKHGLARIDWSAASLVAAGGKIVENGADWMVVLPAWNAAPQAVNAYTLSAVAVDHRGNVSHPSATQVTLQAPEVSTANSSFTPATSTLPADGKSVQVLTLSLKDGQGNAMAVPVAEVKITASGVKSAVVSPAQQQSTGVFDVIITAGNDAETVIMSPSVKGLSLPAATVVINDVTPVSTRSSIGVDRASYVVGEEMALTVTLKDAQGDAVVGQASALTAGAVSVPGAVIKAGSGWTDGGDGSYAATYTATTAGTGNRVSLKLSGWDTATQSEKYDITPGTEAPASIQTQVNTHTFTVTGEKGAFPHTGFTGATFTLVPRNNASASNYTWTSDASWITVTDGVVKFTGKGSGDKVTITGTPTNGQDKIIRYSFTLSGWFINSGSTTMLWSEAGAYCSSQPGYSLPTVAQMTLHSSYTATQVRGTGALWNEWGNLVSYAGADFQTAGSWSSDEAGGNGRYMVGLSGGSVARGLNNTSNKQIVVCRQGF